MKTNVPNNDLLWQDKKRLALGIPFTFTKYFLYNEKLITKSGLVMVETNEVDLYKIIDKKIITSPFGRLLNYGSIILYTKDTNGRVITLKNIKNVENVYHSLSLAIDKQRDKYYIRGRDMYGGQYYSK